MSPRPTIVAFAALVFATAGMADEPEDAEPGFETVLKRFDGGPKKAAEVVIRTEAEWEAFIDSCPSEDVRRALRSRKVDFGERMIVALAFGRNSSILGHPDYEKQAGVQRVRASEGKQVVEYNSVFSDHQDTEPRYPLHVIEVDKADGVTFRPGHLSFAG